MSIETLLQTAASLLAPWTQETAAPEANRLDVIIDAANLRAAVQALHDARWGYLITITGLDLGVEAGQLEVLYHFAADSAIVTLKVRVPRENPAVDSICDLIPSVSFYERELMEMLGVTVVNTPDTSRLFLPEDWPDGVYPLRKDFKFEELKL